MKLISILSLTLISVNCDLNVCGDWIQYKDLKCIKVLEKKSTEDKALSDCKLLDKKSSLLTIHSKEEQQFINNALNKYQNISGNIWIGLKCTIVNGNDVSYQWLDGSTIDYTHWSEEALKNCENSCVQMSLRKDTIGKWLDENCDRQALGACQKKPENTLDKLTKIIETHDKLIHELMTESIPLNFIYTQLPWQSRPQDLWPQLRWQDITSSYAGLFFRAEGGDSDWFERFQSDNAPRLVSVSLHRSYQHYDPDLYNLTLNIGEETESLFSGSNTGYSGVGLSYHTSGGEVRPKNTAIKIWKRI